MPAGMCQQIYSIRYYTFSKQIEQNGSIDKMKNLFICVTAVFSCVSINVLFSTILVLF